MLDDLVRGADGKDRCFWATSAPEYIAYHDEEWAVPTRGQQAVFERLCLEGFQSGLSWLVILRKRENFRAAFKNFDIDQIARFTDHDVARLLQDAGIVRNRLKIQATINNARAARQLDVPLDELLWSFAPGSMRQRPRSRDEVPATTAESVALSKELKRRGFRFVGPTTAYAAMQAMGVVDDHLVGCHVAERGRNSTSAR